MTAATYTIVPVLVLFFFTQRYFIKGIQLTVLAGRSAPVRGASYQTPVAASRLSLEKWPNARGCRAALKGSPTGSQRTRR